MTEITETSLLLLQWHYLSFFQIKIHRKKTSDLICLLMKKAKKKHSRLQQNPSTGMPQRAFRIQSNRSVVFPALSYGISPFGFPELRILSLSSFWNHTNTHTHCTHHSSDVFSMALILFFGEGWGTFPTLGGHVFVTFRLRSFLYCCCCCCCYTSYFLRTSQLSSVHKS